MHDFWKCSVNSCSVFDRTHAGCSEAVAIDNVLKQSSRLLGTAYSPLAQGTPRAPSDANGSPCYTRNTCQAWRTLGDPTVAFQSWIISERYHVLSTYSMPVPTPYGHHNFPSGLFIPGVEESWSFCSSHFFESNKVGVTQC